MKQFCYQKMHNNLFIWYFSGTGNAGFAAKKIAETAARKGQNSFVFNMAGQKEDFPKITQNDILVFCYPTHGFNAPPLVLNYLARFPKGKSKVYLLNTRAGMKLYKIHTAGVGGIALWLPALILFLKGYKPFGFRPLDLPSNWISLHPGIRRKVVHSIYNRCSKTLELFTNRILHRKSMLNGLFWLPVDIPLIPVSAGYYFFGRFALAKTFFASYKCNNCGLCIKQCPSQAIIKKNNRPFWTFRCESCMKCLNNCPERAIETAHGFTFLLWWLVFSLVPYLIVNFLVENQFISVEFYRQYASWIYYIIMFSAGFAILFIGYHILHQILRIKILNKLITFTSLTHFKFWRRYKKQKNKVLSRI